MPVPTATKGSDTILKYQSTASSKVNIEPIIKIIFFIYICLLQLPLTSVYPHFFFKNYSYTTTVVWLGANLLNRLQILKNS